MTQPIMTKAGMFRVICRMCGLRFETKRPTVAKFCSHACACRYSRRMVRYREWLAQKKKEAALVNGEIKS